MVVLISFQILDFISNMNDNFYEASFEVYYISVRHKLVNFAVDFFHFDLGHF